ncbi:NAD(P)/FAD-dependent oxidoreductase [bacterium]|nr:MAG: NAD(P)/FAD-dependent oxidoreductase [bacterium]
MSSYDIAIVGGGPAGSTCGTFLKKYAPRLKVLILERERFPRDHVGESQLPIIGQVLEEMGVWDKVERAGFPIKVGATYRWGRTDDLWDFEFVQGGKFANEARPARFKGQRRQTAFQVDRGLYDQILLDHARSLGCEVRQETTVRQVRKEGDRVEGLVLHDGTEVTARHYVDASGHVGVLRRAMGVETKSPTTLQNIAIWDYWQNAEWATTVGVGGTRVLVLSQGYGWLWFIPLGPTRTSIGLIVPAEYYKSSGKRPLELYEAALSQDPLVARLTQNATSEGRLSTTKDWSFLSDRLVGENWFLAGESCGFADPILAAGMSLAHVGARDVAYTILALDKGEHDPQWLRSRYDEAHRAQIFQHIRFADFWYTHNGVFTDLQELTRTIAGERGLHMTAAEAWRWFGTGGFIDHNAGIGFGGYSLDATRQISAGFLGEQPHYEVVGKTHFVADLEGADKDWTADLSNGQIQRVRCFRRDGKYLPRAGLAGRLVAFMKSERTYDEVVHEAGRLAMEFAIPESEFPNFRRDFLDALEALVGSAWVVARTVEGFRPFPALEVDFSEIVHTNRDIKMPVTS